MPIECRAPSCPEIPEISQMSWNCPEIRNCPEILLIWSECPEIDLCYAVVTALPLFCTLYFFNWTLSVLLAYLLTTISPYVHCSFMCNIALLTFFGLQYWSDLMNNIYEHIIMSFFCVLSLVKPTKMSWNFLKIGSWNFTSCCWEPWECRSWRGFTFVVSCMGTGTGWGLVKLV